MAERHQRQSVEHSDTLPSSEQLSRLAGRVIELAREQKKFRSGMKYENSRFFKPQPVDITYLEADTGQMFETQHTLVGHIRRIAPSREFPERRWSMRLSESLWQMQAYDASSAQGIAAMYSFEWNDRVALKSLKNVRHTPSRDTPELIDQLDSFTVSDDAAFILATEMQMQRVTAGDCSLLDTYVQEFCERSSLRAAMMNS